MHTLTMALDLAVDGVSMHQQRTAVICRYLAEEIGIGAAEQQSLLGAALMHDIGAAPYYEERRLLLDPSRGCDEEFVFRHAEEGYRLLLNLGCLSHAAEAVRYHHDHWTGGNPSGLSGTNIPLASRIIHVADRAEILLRKHCLDPDRCGPVCADLLKETPVSLEPSLVDALMACSKRECFWLDMTNNTYIAGFHNKMDWGHTPFTARDLLDVAGLYSIIIDRTSRFTATHSRSVSRVAALLADAYGFSKHEVYQVRVAGLLHDLGKLSVPNSILEKPGKLEADETRVMRQHTYYTYRILEQIEQMENVACWAAYHHETLDGSGYPFHIRGDQLPLGSRIMAVADIFVALSENRPYRKAMDADEAEKILRGMVRADKISGRVTGMIMDLRDKATDIVRDSDIQMLEAFGAAS
jgi:putative nucleotidyltransferase with HDIG domain